MTHRSISATPVMRRARVSVLATAALVGSVLVAPGGVSASASAAPTSQSTSPAASQFAAGRYIVTFTDEPVASYTGYERGFPATQPARGQKLDPGSRDVQAWQAHLTAKHDAALARVGATKIYDYTVTNNAVAAELTARQASTLAKDGGVVSMERDRLVQPTTTLSPHFLGLDAPGGVWSQLGGQPGAGKGLVIGVIDSGIWPENPSFASNAGIAPPADWHGTCQPGENFPATTCNSKLLGARYYTSGFGASNVATEEYLSARDGSGHGSHTASTAAGNSGVNVSIDGNAIGTA